MTNGVDLWDNFLNLSQFYPVSKLQLKLTMEQNSLLLVWRCGARSWLRTLMITCETKRPGVLVKGVWKVPPENSNLDTSVAAQGTRCQHKAAHSCKIWHSSGKASTICLSFWHLFLSVLSSFNKNQACFACQASWLILVTALVKHKELLDKQELQLKPLTNANRTRSLYLKPDGLWKWSPTLISASFQAILFFLFTPLFLLTLQLQKRSSFFKKVTGIRLSSHG